MAAGAWPAADGTAGRRASVASLHTFVTDYIEPGARAITDT